MKGNLNLHKRLNALRQSKEFQRNTEVRHTGENSFIIKLRVLRKKYPNDADFGEQVNKLLEDGNNI
jgi:hypothetical protein